MKIDIKRAFRFMIDFIFFHLFAVMIEVIGYLHYNMNEPMPIDKFKLMAFVLAVVPLPLSLFFSIASARQRNFYKSKDYISKLCTEAEDKYFERKEKK